MDRGPFVGQRTAAQTAVLYMLPLYPKQGALRPARQCSALPSSGASHAAADRCLHMHTSWRSGQDPECVQSWGQLI